MALSAVLHPVMVYLFICHLMLVSISVVARPSQHQGGAQQ
jgi:hypothetical protein